MKKKVEGCWPVRTLVRACLLLGLLPAVCPAAAENLRSPRDARAWSVLLQADETLRWRWHAEATEATLTASNLLTGVVATSAPVVRGGDVDGACAIPSTGGEDARLVDVTLVQLDGAAALETQTARLQIGMRAGTVFTTTEAQAFHEIQEPKPFAWSDAWTGREAAAAALVVADETGALVADGSRDKEEVLLASFDLDQVEANRMSWGVFRDRRPECYGEITRQGRGI